MTRTKETAKFEVPMPEDRGTVYVAMGPFAWGGGLSREQAMKRLREEASYSGTYTLYRIDGEFIGVNGMGGIMIGRDSKIHKVAEGTITRS